MSSSVQITADTPESMEREVRADMAAWMADHGGVLDQAEWRQHITETGLLARYNAVKVKRGRP